MLTVNYSVYGLIHGQEKSSGTSYDDHHLHRRLACRQTIVVLTSSGPDILLTGRTERSFRRDEELNKRPLKFLSRLGYVASRCGSNWSTMDTANDEGEQHESFADRIDCPCHNFTALSKIVDVLEDDGRTRAMISWLNGDTDKLSMEQQILLSCGKRFQCRFRYGTSFAILNAIRDACKPFLDAATTPAATPSTAEMAAVTAAASAATNPSAALDVRDETSFPPLPTLKSQKQSLRNHPGLSNFLPAPTESSGFSPIFEPPKTNTVPAINTLPTRNKKSKRRIRLQGTIPGSSDGGGFSGSAGIAPKGSPPISFTHQTANEWTRNIDHRLTADPIKESPRDDSPPSSSSIAEVAAPVWTCNVHSVGTMPTAITLAVPTVERTNDNVTPGTAVDVSLTVSTSPDGTNAVLSPPLAESSGANRPVTVCSSQLRRLVDVYVALIRNMLVPSTPLELHFLLQLIIVDSTTPSASREVDTQIKNTDSIANPSTAADPVIFFQPILQGREQCIQFSQNALLKLEESLLQRLSPFILKALVRSEAFQRACPSIAKNLNRLLDDHKASRLGLLGGTSDDIGETLTGTHAILTLPFERDRDSRHNYKTQAEVSIYQNREESRDAFLSQLRNFMTAKSKVFLNEDVDRAREVVEQESRRIIRNISSVNMVWFAQFFCDLLLQVGRSPVEEMDPDLLKIADDRERLQQLHRRFSKKIPHTSTKNSSKKLLFSGQRNGTNNRDSAASPSPFQEALASFTGYQEFFFLFLYSVDSYNFGVHVMNQIATITKNLMSDRSPSGLEKRALDLQMTARFLGVLVFSPNWRGEAVDWSKIKPVPAADSCLAQMECIGLPLSKVVREAWEGGFLLLVVPWITEFLKMSKWDTFSQSSRFFRQVLANLRMIQSVATSKDAMFYGANMQLVSFHLESFFSDTFSLPKLTSLPPATLPNSPESLDGLDRLDVRLSPVFLFVSSPYVEELGSLLDGGVPEDKDKKLPNRPKKLRPPIIRTSLNCETRSFLLESPEGKPLIQSRILGIDYCPDGKRWAIQKKLADEFFHRHRDLKIICDFAVDQTLKTLSENALAKFAAQALRERKITAKSPERDLEDFKLRALELSEDHIRDQLRDRVDKSLTLFGPSGLNQKVHDTASNLSVTAAIQSCGLLIRSMVSAESKIVLEGFGAENKHRCTIDDQEKLLMSSEAAAPEHLIEDAIRSIDMIQKNLSSTDPAHNLRLLRAASGFVELLSKSALIPSNETNLRHLFETIFELDRVSEEILVQSLQSDDLYPWRVFVQFLCFASNLSKISSHGMKHLSGILGEEFLVSVTSSELESLSKESQGRLFQLVVTLGSKANVRHSIEKHLKPRAIQFQ